MLKQETGDTYFLRNPMTTIELTREQQQALQAEQGKPVDVVDPATQQRYVLLAQEQYDRVRSLLEQRHAPAVAEAHGEPKAASGLDPSEGKVKRLKLRELPMPPEVAEEVRQHCKKLGLWRRRSVQDVEDEFKLQYYFGGQPIYVLPTPEGRIVIPIEERYRDTPGLRDVLLTPEERSRAVLEIPSPWRDTVSQILSS